MLRGRPKKPARIREMEGNPGKRRIPKEIAASGLPRPPEGLTEEEFELWTEVYRSLPLGLLTSADSSVLERFACAWARWRQCQRNIRDEGLLTENREGKPIRSPWLLVQRACSDEMHRCGTELGLSPVARTRLAVPAPHDDDPLSMLLDGRAAALGRTASAI